MCLSRISSWTFLLLCQQFYPGLGDSTTTASPSTSTSIPAITDLTPVPFRYRGTDDGKDTYSQSWYHRGGKRGREGDRRGYKKLGSNDRDGNSAGRNAQLNFDQAALREQKQRHLGHVDHDSHDNQEKFVKMIWDKGDGFVKRWHWDRGEKLKDAVSETAKKHLEHHDKAHSNELIERQKGQVSKHLLKQGSKSNRFSDDLDKKRANREHHAGHFLVNHFGDGLRDARRRFRGSGIRPSREDDNKQVGEEEEEEQEEEQEDDDHKSDFHLQNGRRKSYRESANDEKRDDNETEDEDDEDGEEERRGRRKTARGQRRHKAKFPRFSPPKFNRALDKGQFVERILVHNLPDSDEEAQEDDKKRGKDEKRGKSDLTEESDEDAESSGEDEDANDEESKSGNKKVKKKRDFQRRLTVREEKSELKAVEKYQDPKEDEKKKKDDQDEEEEGEDEQDDELKKKKTYYKRSKGSGFIKHIRANSNDKQPSHSFSSQEQQDADSKDAADKEDEASRKDEDSLEGGDNIINEVKVISTPGNNKVPASGSASASSPHQPPSSSPPTGPSRSSNGIDPLWRPKSDLCNELGTSALGMESGAIKSTQITASSSYNHQSVGPQNARLNREDSGGAWCPKEPLNFENSGHEWIQVNLTQRYVITAIATQGRFGNGHGLEFMEEYLVEYSRDYGSSWSKWKNPKGQTHLRGNTDTYSNVTNTLDIPIVAANMIRIYPFAKHSRTVCLRFELFGCPYKDGPLSYSMPDGAFGGRYGDLIDDSYDGVRDSRKYLYGGLGQLTDGIKGHENYKVNSGYEWIGWEAANETIEITFQFESLKNFTSVEIHTHNAFTKDIEVFSSARIFFSYDGIGWSKHPMEVDYIPDRIRETPRNVIINLKRKVAKYLKFSLKFASKLLLISEIKFNSLPIDGHFAGNLEDLESPESFSASSKSLEPVQYQVNSSFEGTLIVVSIISILIILMAVATYVVYIRWYKHGKSGSCSDHHHFYPVDINYLDATGTSTISTTKVTTPVYCEPEELSSPSHRHHHQHNYLLHNQIPIARFDHEYAVPDVIYQNGVKAKRIITNPLSNLEKLIHQTNSKDSSAKYLLSENGVVKSDGKLTNDRHDLKPITEGHQKINVMSATAINSVVNLNSATSLGTPKSDPLHRHHKQPRYNKLNHVDDDCGSDADDDGSENDENDTQNCPSRDDNSSGSVDPNHHHFYMSNRTSSTLNSPKYGSNNTTVGQRLLTGSNFVNSRSSPVSARHPISFRGVHLQTQPRRGH